MMSTEIIFILLVLLVCKHYACDFVLQTNSMLNSKNRLFSPWFAAHSGSHALGTFLCFVCFVPVWFGIIVALLDFILHHLTDWGKSKFENFLCVSNSDVIWWNIHAVDQLIHMNTYLILVYMCYRFL